MSLKPLEIKTNKTRIRYSYSRNGFYSEIWFQKIKYSKEELELVNQLFNNLDEGNLGIMKAILHSKTKSKIKNKTNIQ